MPRPRLILGTLERLEDALSDAVARARPDDALAPVTVLIGQALLRPYLQRRLAARGIAQINVRFMLPHELAAELAPKDDRPRLTPAVERLLVRETAESARGYFEGIAGREGFVKALRRLFRDLEMGGFTPESFAWAATASAVATNRAKLDELARIFASYEARRAAFASAADMHRAADASGFEGPLLVYGVWAPRALESALIARIAEPAAVTVFLPSSGNEADEAHQAFGAMLRDLGAEEEMLDTGDDASAFALLRDAVLRVPGGDAIETDAVELIGASDTVREVWDAARTCLRWASDGMRFHEMAVVYRNADPYRALVDEIFAEAGIETYLHEGRLLASHPLGRRVLSVLELAAVGTFPRAGVMEFLTETELPRATRDKYDRVRPSEWETFTREAGIVEGAEQWEDRLERLAKEKRADAEEDERRDWLADVANRVDTFRGFTRDFAAALASRPDDGKWEEHLAWLKGIVAEYADGVEPIIDALEDLKQLAAVTPRVPFDVFCRAVRDDLESRDTSRVLNEPVRLFGRRGVAVIDATSLRHLRFRGVYMLGAAERAWPPPPRPDPLLLEHERRSLNAASVAALPMRTEPDDEALTFWLGLQAPSEQLRISYARADAGRTGKHTPSYFLRAVVEALEGDRIDINKLESSKYVRRILSGSLAAPDGADPLSPAEYDRTLIHAYLHNSGDTTGIRALASESPSFGRAIDARSARWGASLTAYDGTMISAGAIDAARDASPFSAAVSPSRLEMYAECPYRYFLRYGLRIEPLQEPDDIERIDNLERGSLIHEILERFMREISAAGDPPRAEARERHIARLLDVAHDEGRKREERGLTGRPLLWAIDQRQIHEDLVRWYDVEVKYAAAGMTPKGFEVSFGPMPSFGREGDADPMSSEEPLVLRVDGREIRLQGRIDRVDVDEERDRFRVIDYKTGKFRRTEPFDHGKALQLPVYLRAASELLGIPPESGDAQYYFASGRGGFQRKGMTGEELKERAGDFEQMLQTIADGVEAGMFAPNPGKGKETCRWCDYTTICDARIDRIAQRKRGDERAEAYIALESIN